MTGPSDSLYFNAMVAASARQRAETQRALALEAARARVLEAAKAWKHSDGVDPNVDLALDAAVVELERLETEAQS